MLNQIWTAISTQWKIVISKTSAFTVKRNVFQVKSACLITEPKLLPVFLGHAIAFSMAHTTAAIVNVAALILVFLLCFFYSRFLDCNDRLNNLNDPPELFNCRRDDTWCSPSGYCYECPEEGCGDNEICSEGLCIPWYCDPDYYYADKICDCNCGSYDPGLFLFPPLLTILDCLLAGNDIAAKDARDVVPCIELFESCPDAVSSLDGTCAYCTPECREGSSCVYYEDEIGICECLDECDTDVGNSLYCGFPYDDPCGNIVCAGDYCPNDAYCSWEYSPFWWEQFFNDEEYVEYCECDTICDQPEDHPCSIEYYDDCGIYCGIGTSCPDDQYCGFYGCVDWQCDPTYYGTDDGCDCECGGWDPGFATNNFFFLSF